DLLEHHLAGGLAVELGDAKALDQVCAWLRQRTKAGRKETDWEAMAVACTDTERELVCILEALKVTAREDRAAVWTELAAPELRRRVAAAGLEHDWLRARRRLHAAACARELVASEHQVSAAVLTKRLRARRLLKSDLSPAD
ncbi:MAG TPA: hypothetical protein PLQ87_09715, partial [Phycisphaerae bacterium]|nr:hypothetical protein [Phycisphaerae bacterium]